MFVFTQAILPGISSAICPWSSQKDIYILKKDGKLFAQKVRCCPTEHEASYTLDVRFQNKTGLCGPHHNLPLYIFHAFSTLFAA